VINPISDSSQWGKVQCIPITSPFKKKLSGRRKKKRKRGVDEPRKNIQSFSKVGIVMKCRNCKEIDHNTRTCKNSRVPDPIRVPTENKRERPRKNAVETTTEKTDTSTSTPTGNC